ncbi:MAG TPA: hypothetical protein VM096_13850 [Vicinamibacterales bacterium]|nr:hypothetical protein [Vicinamibacterales bacterium]
MRLAATVLATFVVLQSPLSGWGFEAHKFITDRMIAMLPAELRPLFDKRRAYIVEHSIDPDLWRNVGWDQEPPNHYVDIDNGAFGTYPFAELPRDYDAAVLKFGKEFLQSQGVLPWRVAEFHGRLRREFESLKRKPAPGYALDNIALYSAVLAHYVADGHVPLHSAANHDGQLTEQNGLHSRWEAELFERNRNTLRIAPVAVPPVTNARDFMFDALLASNRAVANVLESDRKAAAGREFYDDAYFDALAAGTLPVLEKRLNESIAAVAAMITGAWEQAGRPAVPTELPRTPRRVRRQNP